jgi:hypothetical protein
MTHLSKQEFALTAIFFFKEAWPQYIIAKTQDTKVPVYAWIFFIIKVLSDVGGIHPNLICRLMM